MLEPESLPRSVPRSTIADATYGRRHRADACCLDVGDPVTFATRHIPAEITDMTMTPLPVAPIPLWIGGSSDAALCRAIRLADGWHGSRETPEQTAPIVQRLRAERPDRDFTISMRVNWNGHDLGELRDRIAAYEAAGVQHILVASDLLRSAEIDNWDGILDGVGRLVAESRM